MLAFLSLLYFVLAAFDCTVTCDRIRKYGSDVELNRGIRKLVENLGTIPGVLLGLWVPSLAWVALCIWFRLDHVLSILVGARGLLAILQLRSLREGEVLPPSGTLDQKS